MQLIYSSGAMVTFPPAMVNSADTSATRSQAGDRQTSNRFAGAATIAPVAKRPCTTRYDDAI